ncbi:MAG: hypothetical protein WD360_07830 [Nitriliruptoraceae bacterium]
MNGDPDTLRARRLFGRLEAIHTIAYFAPHVLDTQQRHGFTDRSVGYVAARSSALGQVPAEVVTALFYSFSHRAIARAIPHAYSIAEPSATLAMMSTAVREVLEPLFADVPDLMEVADAAYDAAALHPLIGAPLGAAWASVAVSDNPALKLWQAATIIREVRGDTHIALLMANGLDGVEAHLTTRGDTPKLREIIGQQRLITDDEFDQAVARLQARGLLETDGSLSAEGETLRAKIEHDTDQLLARPWQAFGDVRADALIAQLDPLVARIIEAKLVPGIVARAATV